MSEEFQTGQNSDSRLVARLEATLGLAAAVVLFGTMTVTVVDVIGRYAFDAPLPAGYELIQIAMALLVFLILPILTARDEHVRIDIFERVFPARIRPALRLVGRVVSLAIVLGFAWLLWRRGVTFAGARETTSNLRAPMAPIAFFIAGSWAAAAAILAWQIFAWRARRRGGPS